MIPLTAKSIFNKNCNRNIVIDDSHAAVTLTAKNTHVMIVAEWFDEYGERQVKRAHLTANKYSACPGEVVIDKWSKKNDYASKTWRIHNENFYRMWNLIELERDRPDKSPMYFDKHGVKSMFCSRPTDYYSNDAELNSIKREGLTLYTDLCDKVISKGAKNAAEWIQKNDEIWDLTLHISVSSTDEIKKKQKSIELAEKIEKLYKNNVLKKREGAVGNCASWAYYRLKMAGIKTKKPPFTIFAWDPNLYVQENY